MSALWPTGLGDNAHPRRLTDFVDKDRSAVDQLTVPECERSGFKREIQGGMDSDQPPAAHYGELAAVLVK